MIKVLVIIPTLDVGGAEMDLVRCLPRLDPARFSVVVWTHQFQGPLAPFLLDRGVEVVGPGLTSTERDQGLGSATESIVRNSEDASPYLCRLVQVVRRTMRLACSGARFIRTRDFDIVHAILPNAYLLAVLANTMAGRRPLVMSRLSQSWYHDDHPLFGFVERHLLHRAADAAIGNADVILRELRREGFPDRKLSLIHNGIDDAAFIGEVIDRHSARRQLNISQDALVLTSLANLHTYKGHHDLIEALGQARSKLPADWTLLVVGGDRGGNLKRLERLILARGLTGHVRFLGQRLDILAVLPAGDIHVSASHHEGFPNNILEAMFAGLPVVATAVGGVPDQIADGESGLLVPSRAPGALCEAIVELAHAPDRRALMGRNGRQRVERKFTIGRSVAAFEQIYEELARRRRDNALKSGQHAIQGRGA